MRIFVLLAFIACMIAPVSAQAPVYFYAKDQLKVRGDLYLQNNQYPFIVLCHENGSNRSEYYNIAKRLLNLNYNCLAIDLRSGGESDYTENETSARALAENKSNQPADAIEDIRAAIRYIQTISNQQVILLGSSFSASLCLLTAVENPLVRAVIALSPGEYLQPFITLSEKVDRINQQVFVTATSEEYPYVQKMLSTMSSEKLTLFKPENGKGLHGLTALENNSKEGQEYWFALMMFFKKLT